MDKTMILVFTTTLLMLSTSMVNGQKKGVPTPSPAPAPAPGPTYVNLTELLSVAGPFHTFLNYLESTKVIDTLQNQANNTDEGLTLFVPKDSAFSSLKKPSLSNLTQDQLKKLCLFHALPHYYSLADFRNLSGIGGVNTLAGGDYLLNFTDVSGTIHMTSGWSVTKISSSVWSTEPVGIYQVDKVLLPEAIFGTNIPPMPAPAPAPDVAPTADAPADAPKDADTPTTSPLNASNSCRAMASLALALAGGLVLFL
ncbi:fasciclin-like arabinogalactan protein 7 [Amaranthus tricolor]|uniref:fasciclin-like arabinogalactan protein 7 n=1 Tax=Amaranthus tricolor TaxID=29722 RepID=UPI00258E2D8E|nr:fasciclin-like arabinogalactan protein 7 [Amaranthus tricolor]